jgi:Domain of unknown function (DUF6815)
MSEQRRFADAAPFQALRRVMEGEWTPQMMQALDIDESSLPVLWTPTSSMGRAPTSGNDTYVLCEINVSSVIPFPDQVPAAVARLVPGRLQAWRQRR